MPGPLRALLDEHGPFKAQHVTAQPAAFAKRFGEKRRGLDVLPMVRRHAGSDSTAPPLCSEWHPELHQRAERKTVRHTTP
jgi:hypothetical protein